MFTYVESQTFQGFWVIPHLPKTLITGPTQKTSDNSRGVAMVYSKVLMKTVRRWITAARANSTLFFKHLFVFSKRDSMSAPQIRVFSPAQLLGSSALVVGVYGLLVTLLALPPMSIFETSVLVVVGQRFFNLAGGTDLGLHKGILSQFPGMNWY